MTNTAHNAQGRSTILDDGIFSKKSARRMGLILSTGAVAILGLLNFVPRHEASATPAPAIRHAAPSRNGRPSKPATPSPISQPAAPTNGTPPAQTPAQPAPAASSSLTPVGPGPSSPPAQPSSPAVTHGILPPQNPPNNIPPSPNFTGSCSSTQYDDSSGCVQAVVAAIDNARQAEGLPAISLPGNWGSLSAQDQLLVATNLERTVRGLPALSAAVAPLDQAAAVAATARRPTDPSPPAGFGWQAWYGNWAGAVGGNPLEAIYFWVYDDGPGSINVGTPWGHRDNVLAQLPGQYLVAGVAYNSAGYDGAPSWAELLVAATGPSPVDYSWQG